MNPFNTVDLPPAITDERFAALMADARTGCPGARDQLIAGLLRATAGVARHVVKKRNRPSQLADATGVAFLHLVVIIDKLIRKVETGQEMHYVLLCISRKVRDYLVVSSGVIKGQSIIGRGKRWKVPQCFSLDAPAKMKVKCDEGVKQYADIARQYTGDKNIDFSSETEELLNLCTANDRERSIIKALMEGETVKDVAIQFDTYPADIRNVRGIVRSRFERLFA